ncbi:DedA family protein [Vibrio sp. E150_018]
MEDYITLLQPKMIQQNAWLAFIGIVLLSYLLEDLAIITAAVMASQGSMSFEVALLAILVGIASGDALLYAFGVWARRWRALRYRLLSMPLLRQARRRLKHHAIINIVIIRFIPGLRSVSFTLCGYFRIPFHQFLIAVLLATAAWTALVFGIIYQIGSTEYLQQHPQKWLLGPIALILLWGVNRIAGRSFHHNIKSSNRNRNLAELSQSHRISKGKL